MRSNPSHVRVLVLAAEGEPLQRLERRLAPLGVRLEKPVAAKEGAREDEAGPSLLFVICEPGATDERPKVLAAHRAFGPLPTVLLLADEGALPAQPLFGVDMTTLPLDSPASDYEAILLAAKETRARREASRPARGAG